MQSKRRPMSERDLKEKLTRIVSMIVRLRQAWCSLCGENNWSQLEAGHFWHCSLFATRWDLTNLATLCRFCNQNHEHDPQPFRDYMLLKLGERDYHELAQKAHRQTKMGYIALLDLLHEMEGLLQEEKRKVA